MQIAVVSANKPTTNPSPSFKSKRGLRLMGLNITADGVVKGFFGGNAYLAIIALLFICAFLLKSGLGFMPGYRTELGEARISGVELTNKVRYELTGYKALLARVNQAFIAEKRHHFGEEESVIYLYEEFEALVDDDYEDHIETYLDTPEGAEKEAAAIKLRADIASSCANIPEKKLLHSLSRRLPELKQISPNARKQAISLAQEYALNDAETPDAVAAISTRISNEMGSFNTTVQAIKSAGIPLIELESKLTKQTAETDRILKLNRQTAASITALETGLKKAKRRAESSETLTAIEERLRKSRSSFVDIDTESRIKPVYEALKTHDLIVETLLNELAVAFSSLPYDSKNRQVITTLEVARKLNGEFAIIVDKQKEKISAWRHDESVSITNALAAFFFGSEWQTGSPWQNIYGLMPLFTGSLLVASVSLLFAVPLAIGAALYVNQFARKREAALIKPGIEFIQAIPSVVLGLFGVLVLAGLLKDWSHSPLLAWIPGFPITERLNVLLAALLLAFMAAPTIFTLAEDALNNVPKAFTEASLAMGATKLQTAIKVILPASMSGIIAAVMLGFGRVVGETMVVLMVAGNKAKIPEFREGLGVIGQPVHTMTSIIAQEYGEVTEGSLHWQALFMVGLVLFTISLVINSTCQRVLKSKN